MQASSNFPMLAQPSIRQFAKENNELGCLLHGLAVHTDKIPTERSWETDQFQNIPHTNQPYIYTLLSASHAAPIGLPTSAKFQFKTMPVPSRPTHGLQQLLIKFKEKFNQNFVSKQFTL